MSLIKPTQHVFVMLFFSLRRKGFPPPFRNMRQARRFGLITGSGHPGRSILRSRVTGTMLGREGGSIMSAKTADSHLLLQ